MIHENIDNFKLVALDLDWTIRSTKSGKTFPENAMDWQLMPGRLEKIKALREQGKHIAILTNQGGLLWREATGQSKYPTVAMLGESFKDIIVQLSTQSPTQQDPWYISLYDQRAVDIINKNAGATDEILRSLQKELTEALQQFNVWVGIDPRWRKPEPGMLIVACNAASVPPEDTLFVGDRPEDQQAAEAAKTPFMWAWQFFGGEPPSA
jgi:D-glycero-D-manno-heptose 1,7-bisphosphate phosphatase